jgi:type I restriction enzyme, S subunit
MALQNNLPAGWKRKTVGNLYKVIGGGTPSTTIDEYWNGDIPWISSADIHGLHDIRPRRKITQKAIENSATNCVPENSIIVVTRVGLGKVAITDKSICFSQDSHALFDSNGEIYPLYALYYLSHKARSFISQGRGTTISGITKKQLCDLEFIFPSLNEQINIVSKIEELFTQLDAGVMALKRAQTNLKRYRQSVLQAAVTGELTRNMNGISNDLEYSPIDIKYPYVIPNTWKWKLSAELFDYVTSGSRGWAKYYSDSGPLFIRMGNLDHDTIYLDLKDTQKVNPPSGSEGIRTRLKPNDILVSITADVGMIGLVPNSLEEAYINQHIALARPKSDINPSFLAWFFASNAARSPLMKLQRGATKVGLGLEDITSVWVPIPSDKEQTEIVNFIESQFSNIQSLQLFILKNLNRSEHLRQSILQQAFTGRLTGDPDPESIHP